MFLKNENNFFYLFHPAKCSGTTIKMLLKHFEYKFCLLDIKYKHVDNLYDSSFGHNINYKYLKNNIDNINKYKIILPIRNPIDRIISWIKYNIKRVEDFK